MKACRGCGKFLNNKMWDVNEGYCNVCKASATCGPPREILKCRECGGFVLPGQFNAVTGRCSKCDALKCKMCGKEINAAQNIHYEGHCHECFYGEPVQVGYCSECGEPADSLEHGMCEAPEMVDHPKHYNMGKIEAIDVIEDWGLGFNLGSTVKYIARADHKGSRVEDLKKALWYLQREIQNAEV